MVLTISIDAFWLIGVVGDVFDFNTKYPGNTADSYGYQGQSGNKYNNSTFAAYGAAYGTQGVIVGIALDMTAGKIWWSRNGVWQASGDPGAGTNPAYTGLSGAKRMAASSYKGNGSHTLTLTRAESFAYTIPSGFVAWT